MIRWQTLTLCLAVAALVACGGTTAVVPPKSLAEATSTSAAVAAAPTRSNAPAPPARAVTATTAAPRPPVPTTMTVAVPRSAAPSAAPSTAPTVASSAPTAPPRSGAPTPAPTGGGAGVTPPAGPAAVPQPKGTIPAGWLTYRGPVYFPFAIAYPPDWTVDDSLLPEQRVVVFYGPDSGVYNEEIYIELGQTETGADIDVQRDQFFYSRTDFCIERGIEYTTRRTLSGVPFALLGATCEGGDALTFLQVALGLNGGDEWSVSMRTPYDRKATRLRDIFDPMLATLNIYARAPE